MTELLDREPVIKETVDRVGVRNVQTYIKADEFQEPLLASVDAVVDLAPDKRGVHMSRLVDAIVLSASSQKPSLEDYAKDVLRRLRYSCRKAEVEVRTRIMLPRHAPTSDRVIPEPYDVLLRIQRKGDQLSKYAEVSVVGSTACPHCLEVTGGRTHVQRTIVRLGLWMDDEMKIKLTDLVRICEESLSSPTYAVLKTQDEAALVEKMYETPRLVEDVVRECLERVKALRIKGKVKIRALSQESIHKHDVVSEIERGLP